MRWPRWSVTEERTRCSPFPGLSHNEAGSLFTRWLDRYPSSITSAAQELFNNSWRIITRAPLRLRHQILQPFIIIHSSSTVKILLASIWQTQAEQVWNLAQHATKEQAPKKEGRIKEKPVKKLKNIGPPTSKGSDHYSALERFHVEAEPTNQMLAPETPVLKLAVRGQTGSPVIHQAVFLRWTSFQSVSKQHRAEPELPTSGWPAEKPQKSYQHSKPSVFLVRDDQAGLPWWSLWKAVCLQECVSVLPGCLRPAHIHCLGLFQRFFDA